MNNNYLPRKTFFWATGILVTVLLVVFSGLTAIVLNTQQNFNHNFTEIKVDIGKIQTNLGLLREDFNRK